MRQAAGPYRVTLRLPADGLYAQEEMQIEFRIEDTTRPDPLTVYTPVIRATPAAVIDMPAMPGMPAFTETAHAEGAPGDYGIHPTFAHGGEFRLRIAIEPGNAVEFPLTVLDGAARRKRVPPRYTLELTSDPKKPKAGEVVELRLVVRDREDGRAAVTAFDVMHEKLLHLIVVRRDLAHFAHEHPVLGPDGVFRLRYTFASGGEYRVFADVAPRAAGAQILSAPLSVAGKAEADAEMPSGLVELVSGGQVPVGKTSPVTIRIKDAANLEAYLGAAGHLILIHEDAVTFVHSHPDVGGADRATLVFQARFPKAGVYHAWVQFQRAGTVQTAALRFVAQ
ncbi:MAG: putative lipoprotein [Candidatus Solibacter sp.]|nr:putative lipoprotein [Candidatus Solibacter sp.]